MENQLMLIIGNLQISWFAVFTAAACFVGVCIACLLRFLQHKEINDIFTSVAFGVPLGLLCGRILYIIFGRSNLSGFGQYINLTNGGYGLYGVFLGVVLAVLVAVRVFDADGFGSLLDCIAIGGAFAITVGRFATGFTPAEIGYEVDFKLFAVYDKEQGIYNLAIYQLDGVYEGVIFLICLWFFLYCIRNANREWIAGKTALLMLALHGTNQVVMDSMRADPLKLGMNEFIKISQIIGILCCVAVLVFFLVVTARRNGFGKFHWLSLPLIVVAIILGVFGEYRVGSSNYISNHLIMFAGMVILDWLVIEFALKAVGTKENIIPATEKAPEPIKAEAVSASKAAVRTEKPAPVLPENNAPEVKTDAPVIPAVQKNNRQNSATKAPNRSNKLKSIPVISVDAVPSSKPAATPKAPDVAPSTAKTVSAHTRAAKQTAQPKANKPLGEQELNMDKVLSELEKIEG